MCENTGDMTARKLRVADLKKLVKRGTSWWYGQNNAGFNVDLVWLQGSITSVDEGFDTAQLCDDGHRISLIDCSSVPGGSEWLRAGENVLAVGTLDSVRGTLEESKYMLRVVRLSAIPAHSVLSELWPLEVDEFKQLLLEISTI